MSCLLVDVWRPVPKPTPISPTFPLYPVLISTSFALIKIGPSLICLFAGRLCGLILDLGESEPLGDNLELSWQTSSSEFSLYSFVVSFFSISSIDPRLNRPGCFHIAFSFVFLGSYSDLPVFVVFVPYICSLVIIYLRLYF